MNVPEEHIIHKMANTLKIVLILIGLFLLGYGLYLFVFPENALGFGDFRVENGQNQIWAMMGFGILSLLAGILYKKR